MEWLLLRQKGQPPLQGVFSHGGLHIRVQQRWVRPLVGPQPLFMGDGACLLYTSLMPIFPSVTSLRIASHALSALHNAGNILSSAASHTSKPPMSATSSMPVVALRKQGPYFRALSMSSGRAAPISAR